MANLIFHPDVQYDIKEPYDWYEGKAIGLGDDFVNELESAIEAVTVLPDTWPNFLKGFRRFLLKRFPFSLIYRASKDRIYIVAVMHNSRKPGYWVDRI
jgi:toxin ParE1/3/4